MYKNLYSGSNPGTEAAEKTNQYHYWEVYVEGSWLNPLLDQPPNPPNAQFTYFGRCPTPWRNFAAAPSTSPPWILQICKSTDTSGQRRISTLKDRWLVGGLERQHP